MKLIEITSVRSEDFSGTVYNLSVKNDETYCVHDVAVHNCSTNLQTGFGVPILTNIMDCAKIKGKTWLIADGGCKYSGDIAKAVYFGADFVMTGRLLAATDLACGACYNESKKLIEASTSKDIDTPNASQIEKHNELYNHFDLVFPENLENILKLADEIDATNGNHFNRDRCMSNVVKYRGYHGMASRAARAGILSYASVEGAEGLIKYSGSTAQFIQDAFLHLQASLSYGGAKNWDEFRKKVTAVERSNAGIIAADIHLDIVTDK